MQTCPTCYAQMPDRANFCKYCGTPLQENIESLQTIELTCSACGAKLKPRAKFCHVCGKKIEPIDVIISQTALKCSCGATLKPHAKFCHICSKPVADTTMTISPRAKIFSESKKKQERTYANKNKTRF